MLGDLQNSFIAAQALYLLLWMTEKEGEGGRARERGKRREKRERREREERQEMKGRVTHLEK